MIDDSKVRTLIADDHTLFRRGLRALLEHVQWSQEIEVVGEAGSAREAVTRSVELRPDVVLMDVQMRDGDGLAATQAIRQECPATQVLILTQYGSPELLRRASAAGAAGYFLKDVDPDNLVTAIRAIRHGRAMVSAEMAQCVLNNGSHHRSRVDTMRRGPHSLTEREVHILAALAEGSSDKQTALKLFLSESTVKSHLRAIYRKLGVRNRAQALAVAITNGLLATNGAHAGAAVSDPFA
jgi:DNA-binding NarL/FixJ family response regulator